jgi:hypothetical protein
MEQTTLGAERRAPRGFLTPQGRKWVLTAHVIASVAWIGVSLCLLGLSLTGVLSRDAEIQKAAFVALGTLGTVVAAPVSVAALITGVVVSLGTKWGLFRHWWVLVSFIATVIMTAAVLFALGPLLRGAAASALAAAPGTPVLDAVGNAAVPAVIASCVATVVLSVITGLNVFKPVGRVRR